MLKFTSNHPNLQRIDCYSKEKMGMQAFIPLTKSALYMF